MAQRNSAEEDVRLAESQFYPSLDINSQLSLKDNSSLDGDGRFLLGVNLSFPFYTGGRDYYALDGHQLRTPTRPELAPSREYLEWHADNVFRG